MNKNLTNSFALKLFILSIFFFFYSEIPGAQSKISQSYYNKIDEVEVFLDKTKVSPGDSVWLEITIPKSLYKKYSFSKPKAENKTDTKDASSEKNQNKENKSDLPSVIKSKWQREESQSTVKLKRNYIFLKGGVYTLENPLLLLWKKNSNSKEGKDFAFPEIKVYVKSLLKKKGLNANINEPEQYDILSFSFSYFRLIVVLVVFLILAFLLYYFRRIIKEKLKAIFSKSNKEKEIDAIVLDPASSWLEFKSFLEELLKRTNTGEDLKTLLSEMEKRLILFLSRIYKLDLRVYEEIHLFKKLKERGIKVDKDIQKEFNEIFSEWLLYKYAKKPLEKKLIIVYIHKIKLLAEKIYQEQKFSEF